MFSQTIAWGQVKEISAGIAPFGHWKIRADKVDLLSHSYSISKPAYHIGFTIRKEEREDLFDLFYAKENLIDETGLLNIETNHFAFYRYLGYTIFHRKRIQVPIYAGIGLSYYSQAIPTKLFLDLGGRVRMRFYITNRVALYAGGYYLFGLNGKKGDKSTVFHSGLETGLMFNF